VDHNTLPKRAKRYAQVSGAALHVGARALGGRVLSKEKDSEKTSLLLRAALGGLKGPLMKIAQLLANIPDLLPPEYTRELLALQADAPSMGWPFVRRRMAAELGAEWQGNFRSFDQHASFAASLGQVHHAIAKDGTELACKLQYPDMDSVVEADLSQLKLIFRLFDTFDGAVQTDKAYQEVAARLREELDYQREAHNMNLYRHMLDGVAGVHVPTPIPELTTHRLLSMTWLKGQKMVEAIENRSQEERNQIAINMFTLWYLPFYRYGILHGDPHMGNYTVCDDNSINLLDFGCIRVFEPQIVQAVISVYQALRDNDMDKLAEGFRAWGFTDLTPELVEALTLWARFVYAPLLEDRVQTIDTTNSTQAGRAIAGQVYQALKSMKGVSVPPEFVLIDRASVGLGALFIRLRAEVNWFSVFHRLTEGFDVKRLSELQTQILAQTDL
jgi:predicted unusual protein kinase regulating ubiquinone biosynthesis (AarF/ABC1/UbiB family)